MKYCSACGQEVALKWIEQDRRQRYCCNGCGAIHYENPRIIVCCAVYWRDQVLMCRRAEEPGLGQWVVPSGYLEVGETLEQGAVRETWEETGLTVDPQRLDLCTVVNMTAIGQVAVMFRVEVDAKPDLAPGPECTDAAFMTPDEVPTDQFAWRSAMGDGPERFLKELRSREFTIQLITFGAADGTGFRSREYKIDSIHDTLLQGSGTPR